MSLMALYPHGSREAGAPTNTVVGRLVHLPTHGREAYTPLLGPHREAYTPLLGPHREAYGHLLTLFGRGGGHEAQRAFIPLGEREAMRRREPSFLP